MALRKTLSETRFFTRASDAGLRKDILIHIFAVQSRSFVKISLTRTWGTTVVPANVVQQPRLLPYSIEFFAAFVILLNRVGMHRNIDDHDIVSASIAIASGSLCQDTKFWHFGNCTLPILLIYEIAIVLSILSKNSHNRCLLAKHFRP